MYPTPLFGMLVLKSEEGKKFGFIISKKISKRAVDRNKIKRKLAEGVRLNMDSLNGDYKIVFLAKKILLTSPMEVIGEEIKNWLSNLEPGIGEVEKEGKIK